MPARVVSKLQRSGKIRALLASGLVLGVGATFTLAAWTDNEWVFGGAGPGDYPGTKINEMEQNTALPPAAAKWTDEPKENGGRLDFTIEANDLVPGKTVYAPFQLRAKAGSGDLEVKLTDAMQATNPDPAEVGDANSIDLYEALVYRAWVGVKAADCNAAGAKPAETDLVGSNVDGGQPLSTLGKRSFELSKGENGAAGDPVNLCFAMTLPAGAPATLQGKNVVPLWKFTSSVGQ